MRATNRTICRVLAGRTVQVAFAFLFGVWLLLAGGWFPDALYQPLSLLWLPSYLAFVVASSLRNTALSWLGSGLHFRVVVMFLTYVEAVLLAGLVRSLRTLYRQTRERRGASS